MARILIADDDADVVQFLRAALEAEGYETESVFDAYKAAESLKRAAFDLVILDMGLQGLEREAPARALLAGSGSKARVLILTGRDTRSRDARGWLAGADASLEKGCSLDTLTETVKRLIS